MSQQAEGDTQAEMCGQDEDMSARQVNSQPVTVDNEMLEAYLRCRYLAALMSDCIVEDKYKPPHPLVASLVLTTRGKTLANQVKGDGVSLPEAQLAAFLSGSVGSDLLFVPKEINTEYLKDNLAGEIKRRKIQYPWIFGRTLYDLVAESSFHGDRSPSHEESLNLLTQLPQGVFQMGPYVVGPYGIFESKQWRLISPTVSFPGFHCAELDCDRIHGVYLSTGETGVSKARSAIRRKSAKSRGRKLEFLEQAERFEAGKRSPYAWNQSAGLCGFLFECLDHEERISLMVEILDHGTLRAECKHASIIMKNSREWAEKLDDSQYLQVLLLSTDAEIHKSLNKLVWQRVIDIPDGEIRRCRIIAGGFGALNVRIEASSLGVRYRPETGLLQVRLREIFNACFPVSDAESLFQPDLAGVCRVSRS